MQPCLLLPCYRLVTRCLPFTGSCRSGFCSFTLFAISPFQLSALLFTMSITFSNNEIEFRLLHKGHLRTWLKAVAAQENGQIRHLDYVFCSDESLLEINRSYLNHDTYTDIITFDLREEEGCGPVEGEIHISTERVAENADLHSVPFYEELLRVLAHGLLHLLGYKDKTKQESDLMRIKEGEGIALFYHLSNVPRGTI